MSQMEARPSKEVEMSFMSWMMRSVTVLLWACTETRPPVAGFQTRMSPVPWPEKRRLRVGANTIEVTSPAVSGMCKMTEHVMSVGSQSLIVPSVEAE